MKEIFRHSCNAACHPACPEVEDWSGELSLASGCLQLKTWGSNTFVSEQVPGEGNGDPLQYSCLEDSMDRGAWRATDHGAAKRQTGTTEHARTRVSKSRLTSAGLLRASPAGWRPLPCGLGPQTSLLHAGPGGMPWVQVRVIADRTPFQTPRGSVWDPPTSQSVGRELQTRLGEQGEPGSPGL